ncbi:MAG: RNA polymerase sigma factor [Flavobacteriales bacterium]|nr:RNA polymerase sigma factor [Flavobacteriales bacterium]
MIERCRQGERSAQRELYELYAPAMFNASLRILQSREEAEDVLQECFVKMFKNLQNFRGDASFGSWFKRIVVNASINRLKKRKLLTTELDEVTEWLNDEDEPIKEQEYTIADVQNAVGALSDGYRAVFTMYMFEDYSHKEIANELGVSESTSKSQLNRARKRVKEWLINHGRNGI